MSGSVLVRRCPKKATVERLEVNVVWPRGGDLPISIVMVLWLAIMGYDGWGRSARKLTWSRTRQSSTTTFLARKLAPIVEAEAASKVFLTYLFSGDVSFMHRTDTGRGPGTHTLRREKSCPHLGWHMTLDIATQSVQSSRCARTDSRGRTKRTLSAEHH